MAVSSFPSEVEGNDRRVKCFREAIDEDAMWLASAVSVLRTIRCNDDYGAIQ